MTRTRIISAGGNTEAIIREDNKIFSASGDDEDCPQTLSKSVNYNVFRYTSKISTTGATPTNVSDIVNVDGFSRFVNPIYILSSMIQDRSPEMLPEHYQFLLLNDFDENRGDGVTIDRTLISTNELKTKPFSYQLFKDNGTSGSSLEYILLHHALDGCHQDDFRIEFDNPDIVGTIENDHLVYFAIVKHEVDHTDVKDHYSVKSPFSGSNSLFENHLVGCLRLSDIKGANGKKLIVPINGVRAGRLSTSTSFDTSIWDGGVFPHMNVFIGLKGEDLKGTTIDTEFFVDTSDNDIIKTRNYAPANPRLTDIKFTFDDIRITFKETQKLNNRPTYVSLKDSMNHFGSDLTIGTFTNFCISWGFNVASDSDINGTPQTEPFKLTDGQTDFPGDGRPNLSGSFNTPIYYSVGEWIHTSERIDETGFIFRKFGTIMEVGYIRKIDAVDGMILRLPQMREGFSLTVDEVVFPNALTGSSFDTNIKLYRADKLTFTEVFFGRFGKVDIRELRDNMTLIHNFGSIKTFYSNIETVPLNGKLEGGTPAELDSKLTRHRDVLKSAGSGENANNIFNLDVFSNKIIGDFGIGANVELGKYVAIPDFTVGDDPTEDFARFWLVTDAFFDPDTTTDSLPDFDNRHIQAYVIPRLMSALQESSTTLDAHADMGTIFFNPAITETL